MAIKQNREVIVSDLIGTMLGPKYGLTEVFHATMNPWKVYLTGVLAPINAEPDEDAENEDLDTPLIEDNDSDVSRISHTGIYTPSLNSSSQTQSFGISFIDSSPEDCSVFDCCFTWARYLWYPDWNRIPKEYENQKLVGWYDEEHINDITRRNQEHGVEEKNASAQDQDSEGSNPPIDDEKKNSGSYLVEDDSEEPNLTPTIFGGWKRDPRYLILKGLKVCPNSDKLILDQTNFKESKDLQEFDFKFPEEEEPFRIYIRIRKLAKISTPSINYFHISLYFVNDAETIYLSDFPEAEQTENRGKPTEAYIFQPQIRIKSINKTRIVSEDLYSTKEILFEEEEPDTEDEEDEFETYLKGIDCISNEKPPEDTILELIYKEKRQKAKGHMCSAIWEEIDPERPYENTDPIKSPPFYWIDGELLEVPVRDYFYLPHIRTEFVPIIPISAPDFNWRRNITYSNGKININPLSGDSRDETFLDPLYIAEKCWDSEVLHNTFKELNEEYENWMRAQCQIILSSGMFQGNPDLAKVAKYNLKNHLKIYKRIKKGLQILESNPQARICFCFANKVIQLQNQWVEKRKPHPRKFYWRPFQIAFLLLSIAGIIKKDDVDRNYIDLIWFPTGGGKTEAYLLTAAFTLAYRRRIAYTNLERLPFIENGTYLISRYTLRLLTIQQFRRANLMVLAADYLRVKNLPQRFNNSIIGWLPVELVKSNNPKVKEDFGYLWEGHNWIWGIHRFSVGLWVGSGMTPNRLERSWAFGRPYYGALDALKVKIDITKEIEKKAEEETEEVAEEEGVDQDAPSISDLDEPPQNTETSRTISKNIRNVVREIGDPAQIINCPVCNAILSLPKSREQVLPVDIDNFFILIKVKDTAKIPDAATLRNKIEAVLNNPQNLFPFNNEILGIVVWKAPNIYSVNFSFKARDDRTYDSERLEEWWLNLSNKVKEIEILCVDIRNPGYYYLYHNDKCYDFEIRCCHPKCDLNLVNWAEGTNIPDENTYWTENSDQWIENDKKIARSIPISAYTVDQQIYRRLPTLVIGTVDKFAQLAFNDNAGTMFGHLELCSPKFGFFKANLDNKIVGRKISAYRIGLLDPPEIILQDELHLIVGPLGTMVGIYETIIDELCKRRGTEIELRPKYIASTATIKAGEQQTRCLYDRKLSIFPPYGIDEADSFFLINQDLHPLKEDIPGRLYLGLCCPGKSAQTPLAHMWGSIFQKTYELMQKIKDDSDPSFTLDQRNEKLNELDPYWTIVGYFNAIRELAGVRAVYHQEFVAWMRLFYGKTKFRPFHEKLYEPIELSSRTDSIVLPEYFERLDKSLSLVDDGSGGFKLREPINGVLTTSIFGTGVDVVRLGVMIVNGQPKTTASYIQATGRIGRRIGGISAILLRAGRPRDLDHYEQFSGYHRAIYKYVEPITVMPFSLNSMKIAFGPLAVALLRQSKNLSNLPISTNWRGRQKGHMNILNLNQLPGTPATTYVEPINSVEFNKIVEVFEKRLEAQDNDRKPKQAHYDEAKDDFLEKSGRWQKYAANIKPAKFFAYSEATMDNPPSKSVVLGDPQHQVAAAKPRRATSTDPLIHVVFPNSPMSLRGVEKMTTFGIFADYEKTKEKIERRAMKRRGGKRPGKQPPKKPPKRGTAKGGRRRPPKGVFRRR